MKIKTLLSFALMALPTIALCRDFTVASWGGTFQAAQAKTIFRPFLASTPLAMKDVTWEGGLNVLRDKAKDKIDDWDVVMLNAEDLLQACDAGLLAPLNWAALDGRQKYLEEAVSDCGVGAVSYSLVLGYDQRKMKGAPQSWADFWNVEKFPGKRALRHGPKSTLEFALMADGVPPREVYQVLSTAQGVDRAFKKLDMLKPNLVWWESASQPAQMLGTGEVVMAAAYNMRLFLENRANKKNFKWVWANSLYTFDSWAILKTATHKSEAEQFLAFASRPETQAAMAQAMPYGVTRKAAMDLTARMDLPSNPENKKDALQIDEKFWAKSQDKLNQRFIVWMMKEAASKSNASSPASASRKKVVKKVVRKTAPH